MHIAMRILLVALLLQVSVAAARAQAVDPPDTVVVQSGSIPLRALLWRPAGDGPLPGILFSHGRGLTPLTEGRVENVLELGNTFARHGYVFLALFRRGEDLSAGRGPFIGDLLEQERAARGVAAMNALQVRLLASDHLEDALAGLAFLRSLPPVDGRRTAAVGHSFGGSLSLLVAERDSALAAVVNFAGAAGSWAASKDMRTRLLSAVGDIGAPVMFVYAANDFSVEPGRALAAEMKRRSKPHELLLLPALGKSPDDGHALVYKGVRTWEGAVFDFLDTHLKP